VKGEGALRFPVRCFLEGRGYDVFEEVAIAGRFADLIGIWGDEVVAVELKLTEWRSALAQSRAYQLGARLVYVAMPLARAERILRGDGPTLQADGVGLLGVHPPDGPVLELLEPLPSPRFLPFLSEGVVRAVRAEESEGAIPPSLSSILAEVWAAHS
jgi:hypothetical protein